MLLLEPSQEDAGRVVEALRADGLDLEIEQRDSLEALQNALVDEWDVVVSTDELADGTLQDVLTAARAGDTDLPVVAISTSSGDHPALEALRAGAKDFVDKADLGRLAPAVRRAVGDASVRRERRDASDRLETSEARFRAAVEGGFDAFFVFDYELDPARGRLGFRLVEVNSHGTAIFGATREELVGRFFDEIAPATPERIAHFSERFRKVYELGTAFEEEYEVQTDAIDARWLHYQVVPLLHGVALTVRDITERKRNEEALRKSEAKYRALVEQASDGILITDQELRFLDANESALALIGCTLTELQRRHVAEFFEGSGDPGTLAQLRAGGTVRRERTLVRRDGTRAHVYFSLRMLDDGRIQAIVHDMTEGLRRETQLLESERRLRNVVQHVPGVFFTLAPHDGEGADRLRFDFLSDGIKSLTGHGAHEFEGDDGLLFADVVHADDRVTLSGADDLVLAGHAFSVDVRLVHTDGTTRWAHLKAEPSFDEEGRVQSASGVMLDITDRKRTEEALHLRERATEAMTQGLVIIDATTDERPIVYVNPAFEELSGYSREELVGRSPTAFDGPETDSEAVSALLAALEKEKSFSGEMIAYRKNGTAYWSSLRISPVYDERGTVTHFISIHTDDTLRRRVEEQFLHAQKMEAVAQLAGGIAHDFNNVLLVIRGYSHVLMSMAGEEGAGWAEAKEIETAATRAADLVSQLLAFSRNQVIQSNVLDLNHAIREAQQLLLPLAGKNIELRLSLDQDVGNVCADPMQLEQAIVNLAVNAFDAMPTGGTLHIRTHNVVVEEGSDHLAQLQPGSYSAFSVEDTGLGMDAGTRARVFEPFFSTKGAAKGPGLGLSAVYGMVKQSGGDITITSAPNEGTSVTIYLPHVGQAVAAVTRQHVSSSMAHDETVLLVEDDEKARALVGRLLRESGYSVHEAALPDEALRVCDEFEGRIHLLLSDVVMPQMSGPKLAKLVLERRPETRVMFVSGYIERPDDVDSVSSGADFLQKPFTPTQLVETVRRVLDNETVKA